MLQRYAMLLSFWNRFASSEETMQHIKTPNQMDGLTVDMSESMADEVQRLRSKLETAAQPGSTTIQH
jgi:hypothetical protein